MPMIGGIVGIGIGVGLDKYPSGEPVIRKINNNRRPQIFLPFIIYQKIYLMNFIYIPKI